jgi:hypothetical protein
MGPAGRKAIISSWTCKRERQCTRAPFVSRYILFFKSVCNGECCLETYCERLETRDEKKLNAINMY